MEQLRLFEEVPEPKSVSELRRYWSGVGLDTQEQITTVRLLNGELRRQRLVFVTYFDGGQALEPVTYERGA